MKLISMVIPLYNEEASLAELYRNIIHELDTDTVGLEIIFVDDGSTDSSFAVLKQLQDRDSRIRVIRFRRNFGKSAALSAGFRHARGDTIVTMDADLQDQPHQVGKLVAHLEKGYDLVSGWKVERQDSWRRRIASRIFNYITSLLTGVPLHDINCGLKAYRKEVIQEVKVYGEMHRYIPVLASYRGFRVGEVPVDHASRPFGQSKYGAGRFLGSFFDLLTVIMLTRYNSKPLHVFGILGVVLLLIGFLIEAYLTVGWFLESWIQDRPIFMLGILLLIMGIQFIFFGLLAEMIAYSSRREDDYSVREVLASASDGSDVKAFVSLRK